MDSGRVIVAPASLKGVLSARTAARALAEGFRSAGIAAEELAIADGGEGTLDVLHAALGGEWREADVHDAFGRLRRARWLVLPDGSVAVESAEVIPLDPERLEPMHASSRGFGELLLAVGSARQLVVGLGGTATMDAGAGLLELVDRLPAPTLVLCDVRTSLYDAPRTFGPQKGATPSQVAQLEEQFRRNERLEPHAGEPGTGAAGGLGAALAALGAELIPGADYVLEAIGFRERVRGAALAVTGEGIVDRTTLAGKAPGAVLRVCREEGVRCVVFGGQIVEPLAGAELYELSGDTDLAAEDLVELGELLGRKLR